MGLHRSNKIYVQIKQIKVVVNDYSKEKKIIFYKKIWKVEK